MREMFGPNAGTALLPYYEKPEGCEIVVGDALNVLRGVEPRTFRCCVTSPPYWGLRDYGITHQIGAEPVLQEYLENLKEVLREVRRVLTDDGTLWLNIGDAYTSGNRTWRAIDKKNPARGMEYRPGTPEGLKPKDLIGIPWRIAFALQADGWFLRSDIIWFKPNCQPESVKDRPTRAHEYIFRLIQIREILLQQSSHKGTVQLPRWGPQSSHCLDREYRAFSRRAFRNVSTEID